MISLINFLNNFIILTVVLFLLAGCVQHNANQQVYEDQQTTITAQQTAEAEIEADANLASTSTHGHRPLIALLPVENLSGTAAPLKDLNNILAKELEKRGVSLVDQKTLDDFIIQNRIRYTGGINERVSQKIRKEVGAEAAFITSLELYEERFPPKIALISRLVRCEDQPFIVWMDSIAMTGDESPGFLELGVIRDPLVLRRKAIVTLAESLSGYLENLKESDWDSASSGSRSDKEVGPSPQWLWGSRKFRPKMYYDPPIGSASQKQTLVVTPFFNLSERKRAGEIIMLHFVEQLLKIDKFQLVEPGVARQHLLRYRVILDDGISIANADLLFREINVDFILTGKVLEYLDYQGIMGSPRVDFSVQLLDRKSRELVWASKSYNDGAEGVFFFDFGKIYTAHALASEMTRYITNMLLD